MRFVKFNYKNGQYFIFCLDDLSTIDSDNEVTNIGLRTGREQQLPIKTNELVAKVFTDQEEEYKVVNNGEYEIVEIDEPEEEEQVGHEPLIA